MKRLYAGLTLLLMAFLASLEHLDRLHGLAARLGVQRWMTELLLAIVAVGLFAQASNLHRRMLFPRRGLRLLLAGIVVYGVGLAVSTGYLAAAAWMVPQEPGSAWAGWPDRLLALPAWPLFLVAQVLLLVGVFRALTNLVPPDEFAEDF